MGIKKLFLLAAVLIASSFAPVSAQNVVPGPAINPACNAQTGANCTIWTPAQWTTAWQSVVSANGGVLTNGTLSGTVAGAATVTATGSTTARTLAAMAADRFNVLNYGADPTGIADSTPAFAAAQNAAQLAGGGVVYVPSGVGGRTYKLNSTVNSATSVSLQFDPGVVLTGTGGGGGVVSLTDQLQGGLAFANFSNSTSNDSTLFVSKNIGVSGATGTYGKNGIYVRVDTGDPSPGVLNLDAVGIETQAQIVTGNMYGRAWSLNTVVNVEAGADGYAVGHELAVQNSGANQPLMDRSNSKLGLTLSAAGTVNSTAALNVNTAGAKWQDGIFIKNTAVNGTALRLVYNTGSAWADLWHIDASGNEIVQNINANGSVYALSLNGVGSANTIGLGGSSTGNPVEVVAAGTDANISIIYSTKGTGQHLFSGNIVGYSGLFSNVAGGTLPTSAGLAQSGAGLGLWWNETGAGAESDFIAYRTSGEAGGFAWYDYVVGGTRAQIATMSSTGALTVASIGTTAYTSSSIGGSALLAGACASTTVSIPGLTTGMYIGITPVTDPGNGFYPKAFASSAGVATAEVCAAIAGTPTASTYNIRVIR